MNLDNEAITRQSQSAYRQWADTWRRNAKEHGDNFPMLSWDKFAHTGIGRPVAVVANGASLEAAIPLLKSSDVDILVCDKALGHLLDAGIKPKYCMVADANVNYEKYCAPWKSELDGTTLFANICSNTKWAKGGNWKETYFLVHQDVLKSEREWSAVSGCKNFMAAGTNVSNALVVLLTQSGPQGAVNFFGYDKLLLVGFDYSWAFDSNYYAFDHDGGGKRFYQKDIYVQQIDGRPCYTSNNLFFSAKWLDDYCRTYHIPYVQTSKQSIFGATRVGDLERNLRYSYRTGDAAEVIDLMERRNQRAAELKKIEERINHIARDHFVAQMRM